MLQPIEVTCYAGFRGYEKPTAFSFENTRYDIVNIIERSIEASTSNRDTVYRFNVMCSDNRRFSILYNSHSHRWFIDVKEEKNSNLSRRLKSF
jgi:hypothetical protein